MNAPAAGGTATRAWPRIVALGLAYFLIGTVTAALSRDPAPGGIRYAWRYAAWLLSAVVFAGQIRYERIRASCAPSTTGLRAALAVAVGGFLLAAWAMGHSLSVGADRIGAHVIALVAWPVLLAVPAFLVAWAAAALVGAMRRG